MSTRIVRLAILVVILAMIVPTSVFGQDDGDIVQATLLHTNDFHGRLETDYRGRGGSAYLADKVNDIRAAVAAGNATGAATLGVVPGGVVHNRAVEDGGVTVVTADAAACDRGRVA